MPLSREKVKLKAENFTLLANGKARECNFNCLKFRKSALPGRVGHTGDASRAQPSAVESFRGLLRLLLPTGTR